MPLDGCKAAYETLKVLKIRAKVEKREHERDLRFLLLPSQMRLKLMKFLPLRLLLLCQQLISLF